jgi:DNA-binding NarL/FixJ family response regulator
MTPDTQLNLVLADGNRTSRKGTELLMRSWTHHVIGVADDARAGSELVSRRRPHLALVDVELPGGVDPVLLASDGSGTRVVLVLGQPDRRTVDVAMGCGASAVVLKSGDPGELRHALQAAARGDHHIAPAVAALVARQQVELRDGLSRREREVLQLLAHGMTGVQASQHLMVSSETVRTHVRNAMLRLGARTRVHAVTMAVTRREINL